MLSGDCCSNKNFKSHRQWWINQSRTGLKVITVFEVYESRNIGNTKPKQPKVSSSQFELSHD